MSYETYKLLHLLGIVLLIALLVFPVYWMLITAVTPSAELRDYPPTFVPEAPQWGIFARVLEERGAGRRRREPRRATLEERHAERRLERGDPATEGRLAGLAGRGRLRQRAVARDQREGADVGPVEIRGHGRAVHSSMCGTGSILRHSRSGSNRDAGSAPRLDRNGFLTATLDGTENDGHVIRIHLRCSHAHTGSPPGVRGPSR